jgi:tRNA(fMet)-specific endonuclease VapC
MAAIVVDTDVVSYLFRRDRRTRAYQPHLIGRVWTISFMAVAELEWGMLHGMERRARLERHLERFAICHSSSTYAAFGLTLRKAPDREAGRSQRPTPGTPPQRWPSMCRW